MGKNAGIFRRIFACFRLKKKNEPKTTYEWMETPTLPPIVTATPAQETREYDGPFGEMKRDVIELAHTEPEQALELIIQIGHRDPDDQLLQQALAEIEIKVREIASEQSFGGYRR